MIHTVASGASYLTRIYEGAPGQIEQDKQNSGVPKRDNSIRGKFSAKLLHRGWRGVRLARGILESDIRLERDEREHGTIGTAFREAIFIASSLRKLRSRADDMCYLSRVSDTFQSSIRGQ